MANKQNPILAAFEAKLRREFEEEKAQMEAEFAARRAALTEINMIATLIGGNNLGFIGEERSGLLLEEQIKTKEQVAKALAEDAKSDPGLTHTKADLARRVKQILGKNWNKYKYLFPLLADHW